MSTLLFLVCLSNVQSASLGLLSSIDYVSYDAAVALSNRLTLVALVAIGPTVYIVTLLF